MYLHLALSGTGDLDDGFGFGFDFVTFLSLHLGHFMYFEYSVWVNAQTYVKSVLELGMRSYSRINFTYYMAYHHRACFVDK